MQRYEIATPRVALGTAAVALTAITLAVLVIIPATMDADARVLLAQSAVAAARDDPGRAPGRLGEHELAAAPCVGPAAGAEDDASP
ncbi:MAG TPA: hypothetical protein VFF44_01905 [Casimicrobiaceae bacterium]|nr:hypothetical protein [Casimicrobiaceae bacterium]